MQPLPDYPEGGEAQIAETMVGPQRLVVVAPACSGAQAELILDWRHFAFLTNRTEPFALAEAEHRPHAVVDLPIRDLKDQALWHDRPRRPHAKDHRIALAATIVAG